MILDWNAGKDTFILRVMRGEHDVHELMTDHGFDLSLPVSTPTEAVLFTREPYAAVTFIDRATEAARQRLLPLDTEIRASFVLESKGHFRVPADKELWPFQKANLAYALRREHTLVADEPGLGKTMTAIVYANELKAKRVLVICPAGLRRQWAAKIREWSTMEWGYHTHLVTAGRHGVHPTAEWTIVSYDLARNVSIGKALARARYDLLVLDEGHYLKTVDAGRTRAVFGGGRNPPFEHLASRARHIMALTGTPLPNRPREAYSLARGLCWDAIDWASHDVFCERFNPSRLIEWTDVDGNAKRRVDERSGRHAELQNRLRANFMSRHLKRDAMPQLKMPIFDLIQVDETSVVKQALAAESMLHIDPEMLTGVDMSTMGHVSIVRKQMGLAIAPQAADYIEELVEGGEEKLVVFGWHVEVLDLLQAKLHHLGVVRVDGSTSAAGREAAKNMFIKDPDTHIILGNLQALGVGVDGLQSVSNHALIVEPSWTPGDNVQAFDRLDRGGQTRQVQGEIFVAPGSFSEKILGAALRKSKVTHKALDKRQGNN